MFYINHNGEEIEIDPESIMTHCPACGREIAVEFDMMFSEGFDWYSTSFYCNKECVNKWKMMTFHEVIDEMAGPSLRLVPEEE